jgi:hypothetical protein
MKNIVVFSLIILGSINVFSQQECERIVKECEQLLRSGNSEFISDGQVYTAFLERQNAEFKTTFYGGTTYRIAASAGSSNKYVIFTVRDMKGNILYSNKNYGNAPYWDFKVNETLPVIIETELDHDLKITGCVIMLIGFKK